MSLSEKVKNLDQSYLPLHLMTILVDIYNDTDQVHNNDTLF